jgi:hypothetical protein
MDPYSFDTTTTTTSNAGLYVGIAVGVILALLLVGFIIFLKRRMIVRRTELLKLRAVSITLPKIREEEPHHNPKDVISVMEQVFTTLEHFAVHSKLQQIWRGQPTFSFEITAKNGEIFFYVLAPDAFIGQLEHQIHAQYPDAHFEQTDDYDIFLKEQPAHAVGALTLQKSYIFPIRTYKNLETDPLNALTSSLSKVGAGKASIQILLQPADQGAHKAVEDALKNVQQGKSFQEDKGTTLVGIAKEVGQNTFAKQPEKQESEAPKPQQDVKLTALQEEQSRQLVSKRSKALFMTQIRVVASAESEAEAQAQVQGVLSAFSQFNAPEANGFKATNVGDKSLVTDYIFRSMSTSQPTMLLTSEEVASVFHLPNSPLTTPNIHWLGSRKLAPPTNLPQSGVAVGYTNYRGQELPVYMKYTDRMRHLYMIGKTGVGKTVLFQNMILQDIRHGHGACYIDPNGDAIEWILRHIPQERLDDVILVDPADTARPLGLNLLEFDPTIPEQRTMVINEMISIFDKLYDLKATGGPVFEQYMRNAMLLIMDDPESGSTLMEISRVLADPEYRKYKLSKCKSQLVIDFWTKEAEKAGGEAALANMVPYITSKLTQFTSNDIMRPMIGQQQSSFDFRKAMDEKKIILVSLPKGLLGEMNAQLLGMIITGKIQIAAFSRQNVAEDQRVPFFLYVDEFQNFTSKAFAVILSEARKYQLSLNITHQYIEQLDDATRSAIIGNVGTMLAWRIGVPDAEFLQKELAPITVDDLVSIDKYNFYIRMLIDGAPTAPFNAISYAPDIHDNPQMAALIREHSRMGYGRDRVQVENDIRNRLQSVLPSVPASGSNNESKKE